MTFILRTNMLRYFIKKFYLYSKQLNKRPQYYVKQFKDYDKMYIKTGTQVYNKVDTQNLEICPKSKVLLTPCLRKK